MYTTVILIYSHICWALLPNISTEQKVYRNAIVWNASVCVIGEAYLDF